MSVIDVYSGADIPETKNTIPENTAFLTFSIEDGETNVKLHFNSEDHEEMALLLGMMLSDVCLGKYSGSIAQILIEIAKENPALKEMVKETLEVWAHTNGVSATADNIIEEPLVRPLRTFGASRFREEG